MADTDATQSSPEIAPAGRRRWWALAVLATGLSMIVIDGTIVNVALPTIISDIGLNLTDAQWINGIYSVIFAALLLTTGRLGDRLGRRRLFLAGIVVFMAGSLLASTASGASSMLWARLIQGIGAAAVLPATLSTVNAAFRGRDRVVAFAVWGSVISGMAALGPLLGGWLTESFSWRWIFIINLPIGVAVGIAALIVVPESRSIITARGLDVDGFLLSCIGFGGIVFALIEGRTVGWWQPADLGMFGGFWPSGAAISPIPVIGAIGIGALAVFVGWERHRQHNRRSALTDLGLFDLRTFSWGNLTALVVAIGEFGLLFVLPLYLVNAVGLSTIKSGLVLAAMGLGAFIAGANARRLAPRVGTTGVVIIGLALETAGTLATALVVSAHTSAWLLAGLLVCYGIGLGLASAQLTSTVLIDVPAAQSGQGSSVQSTVRQLGAGLGTAILGTVLAAGMTQNLPHHLNDQVPQLSHSAVGKLTDATADSGGSNIPRLRSGHSSLGKAGPPAAKALSDGFAGAARTALLTGAGFMAVGLISAVQLRSKTHTATPGSDDNPDDDDPEDDDPDEDDPGGNDPDSDVNTTETPTNDTEDDKQ